MLSSLQSYCGGSVYCRRDWVRSIGFAPTPSMPWGWPGPCWSSYPSGIRFRTFSACFVDSVPCLTRLNFRPFRL